MDWSGMDWIGLDWLGLAWLGLTWLGLARLFAAALLLLLPVRRGRGGNRVGCFGPASEGAVAGGW